MQLSIKKFFQPAIDIIFPAKCIICNALSSSDLLLCSDCWQKIEFITDPKCVICGFPFDFDIDTDGLCTTCNQTPPYFNQAFAILKYSNYSKPFIHKLKYHDQLHIAYFFAQFISNRLQNFYEYRVVVPVPLHSKRIRERLYNQSAILASQIAKLSKLDCLPNTLIKTRYDIPQSQLNRDRRKKNLLNSFAVAKNYKKFIEGKNIILIDDVYTTSSTVNECSKVLKKAGCNKILVVTMARIVI